MSVKAASRIDKVIALVALVLLGAQRQRFPAGVWNWIEANAPWATLVLLIVAGVFSLGPVGSRAESKLTKRRTGVQRQLLSRLGDILTRLETTIPGFDHGDLGMHIWRVKTPLLKPWSRRLERVSTYRLGGGINLRNFAPKKGEGVAGLSWKFNREYSVDVESLSQQLDSRDKYSRFIVSEGDDAVMNLSWEKFQEVKHRGAVAASPIRGKSGRFRGCITLDISKDFAALTASRAVEELNEMAEVLSPHPFEEM